MSDLPPVVQSLIEFRCPHCGRNFSVPAAYAGRNAKCKTCGGEITVPTPAPRPTPSSPPSPTATSVEPSDARASRPAPGAVKLSPRARRLISDAQNMQKRFQACDWIRIREMTGEPADTYTIEYRVASLEHGKTPDKPLPRSEHRVEIKLTADYPRAKPLCRMLTPIFHPNIDTSTICVGDHWTAGERLADLVIRIGEMLAYQAYNIQSPLDAEAAMWADLNQSQLPLDTRNLHPPEP